MTLNTSSIDYFIIEKSKDGQHFDFLKKIEASNTLENTYLYLDENVFTGDNYYRIQQILSNGEKNYSKIKYLENINYKNIQLFPNPTHDQVQLSLANLNNVPCIIQLLNVNGQKIFTIETTESSIVLNLNEMGVHHTSVYFVQVILPQQKVWTGKLVKH